MCEGEIILLTNGFKRDGHGELRSVDRKNQGQEGRVGVSSDSSDNEFFVKATGP